MCVNRVAESVLELINGLLLPHDGCLLQQAMEEKYKVCHDGMSRLLVWISNVEGQLANQDCVREDVAELKNQINVIRVSNPIQSNPIQSNPAPSIPFTSFISYH